MSRPAVLSLRCWAAGRRRESAVARGHDEDGPLPLGRAAVDLARCIMHACRLLALDRIHQPSGNVGRWISFADSTTTTVYRETVIDRPSPAQPAVLVVGFRLRRIRRERLHALFRMESELNTILFAGFPGLISKLWLAHDQNGLYRGLYEWDDAHLASAYARALWWVLALVSDSHSIRYTVLPGCRRDELLDAPAVVAGATVTTDDWWRPVVGEGVA